MQQEHQATIATTINSGTTWVPNISGINELLYCMDFPSQKVGYIGTLDYPSKIIKTTNGGGILSVTEIKENSDFSLYPNPANDILTITSQRTLSSSTYRIIDQTGRIVLSGKLNIGTTKIDIKQLAADVYLFQPDKEKMQSLKVIKQ